MSSEFGVGMASAAKPSCRVTKPPGGGDSNIFGPPQEKFRQPRAKNNQQNSDMMCEIMGRPANVNEQNNDTPPALPPKSAPAPPTPSTPVEEKIVDYTPAPEPKFAEEPTPKSEVRSAPAPTHVETNNVSSGRVKVPPGGFSSGFW